MFLGTRALMAVAFAALLPGVAAATTADHDSRRLTPRERATLLPLVCRDPRTSADGDNHCRGLIDYSGSDKPGDVTFGLAAIIYGSFTHAGADEAYATYYSSNEPHANNFGGGVLFARSNAQWKPQGWFPGELMDQCVAVPGDWPQRMLCLNGWSGQGENDSGIWVSVPAASKTRVPYDGGAVLRAVDTRGTSPEAESGCMDRLPKGRAWLLSVSSLTRSSDFPYFAKAQVAYETAEDIAAACNGSHARRVRETKAIVQFREKNGKVTAVTPIKFVEPRV